MALTKNDIANNLIQSLGVKPRDAKDLVNSFFDSMKHSLESGEEIKLSGFGNFELKDKNARPGRNPRNGEPHQIEARRVVTFSASQKLKDRTINAGPEA